MSVYLGLIVLFVCLWFGFLVLLFVCVFLWFGFLVAAGFVLQEQHVFPIIPTYHFWRTKKFEGNTSTDWIPRVPNQPSSKCKKHCKQFLELARCERFMTTQAEFRFSWVYTFSDTPRSLWIWATHPPRETSCELATQHPLHNCVDHLAAPSHIYAPPRVETGQ